MQGIDNGLILNKFHFFHSVQFFLLNSKYQQFFVAMLGLHPTKLLTLVAVKFLNIIFPYEHHVSRSWNLMNILGHLKSRNKARDFASEICEVAKISVTFKDIRKQSDNRDGLFYFAYVRVILINLIRHCFMQLSGHGAVFH